MLDKLTGGIAPPLMGEQAEAPPPIAEFEGYAECALFAEDAKITLTQDEVVVSALFDQLVLPYGEIAALRFDDYRVDVVTPDGPVAFSRMGQEAEWLYDKLYAAYNDAVLRALLVEGEPVFEAAGDFHIEEYSAQLNEHGVIHLYEDCLCLLPPNENARRIPLCFMTGMEKSDFSRTFLLSTGERFTVSQMGGELDNLDRLITAKLRALREETLKWHRELAPGLTSMQSGQAAKLMPLGIGAPISQLRAKAPALAAGLEARVKETRVAQYYPWLKKLCADESLIIGAKPPPPPSGDGTDAMGGALGALVGQIIPGAAEQSGEEGEELATPPPTMWFIASDEQKRVAAVEMALQNDEAAATYVYRVEGEWQEFSRAVERAIEAAAFRRELVTMTDEKLAMPENAASAMLIKRTPSLVFLRSCFIGRAIHSSQQRWLNDIEKCRATILQESDLTINIEEMRSCTNCGAKLSAKAKFCGQCGSRMK